MVSSRLSGHWGNSLVLWDIAKGSYLQTFELQDTVGAIAISPDGRRAVAGGENTLYIIDLRERKIVRQVKAHDGIFTISTISHDGKHIVTAGHDHTAAVWDIESGEEIRRIKIPFQCYTVATHPDGRHAVLGGSAGICQLWDLERGFNVLTFHGHTANLYAAAVSSDGQRLLTGSKAEDPTVRMWNMKTGKLLQTFLGNEGNIWSVDFLPGGKHVLSGCDDGTMRVWSIESGREVARATSPRTALNHLAGTSDGRYVLSGGGSYKVGGELKLTGDYALRLWKLPESVWPVDVGSAIENQHFRWPADAPPPAIAPFDAEQAKAYQEAWAKHLGVPVEKEIVLGKDQDGKDVTLTMVLIPPGEFLMGCTEAEQDQSQDLANNIYRTRSIRHLIIAHIRSEGPQHHVQITQPFFLGKHEVTQSQWEALMGSNPSRLQGHPTHPVEAVSWNDIQLFQAGLNKIAAAEGLTFALPSEAQWEYACRGGTTTAWQFGDDEAPLQKYGWFAANSDGQTHPVGELRPNSFGLCDMCGSVWEWCADRYADDYYTVKPVRDPSGAPTGDAHVIRGGGWPNVGMRSRSAHRNEAPSLYRARDIGFRLAAKIDQPEAVEPPLAAATSSIQRPQSFPGPAEAPQPAIADKPTANRASTNERDECE